MFMSCNIIRFTTETNYRFDRCIDRRIAGLMKYLLLRNLLLQAPTLFTEWLEKGVVVLLRNFFIRLTDELARNLHTTRAFKDLLDKLLLGSGTKRVPQTYWRWYLHVSK